MNTQCTQQFYYDNNMKKCFLQLCVAAAHSTGKSLYYDMFIDILFKFCVLFALSNTFLNCCRCLAYKRNIAVCAACCCWNAWPRIRKLRV